MSVTVAQLRSLLSDLKHCVKSTERPFVFGPLSKTSQDSVASTSETLFKSLGSIELRYRRIKKCKARNSDVKGDFDTPEPTMVHEDSKLACLAHQGRQVWNFTTIVVLGTDNVKPFLLAGSDPLRSPSSRRNDKINSLTTIQRRNLTTLSCFCIEVEVSPALLLSYPLPELSLNSCCSRLEFLESLNIRESILLSLS